MIAELATEFHNAHKGNCAQSVAFAFAIANGKPEAEALEIAAKMKAYGGGHAPGGTCGALYAAKLFTPEFSGKIEELFKAGASGKTLCREIRPAAIIPCNRCVELAGEALDQVLGF